MYKIIRISTFITLVFLVFSFALLLKSPEQEDSPPLVLTHDKGTLPRFHSAFETQAAAAEKKTGIRFKPVSSHTTDLFISRMEANLPTKEAPALFTWWQGDRVRDLVEKNLVADLTELWDRHAAYYPPSIRQSYTRENRVYGFPYSIEYWPIWYNKKIFERLELDIPETWEDFIKICETLKKNGIPPILSSLQHSWYATIWFSQLLMGEDPDAYLAFCRNCFRDQRVINVLSLWQDMIKKEYFTPTSTRMFTNGGHLWKEEAFAMVLCGSWYPSAILMDQGVPEKDIGVFILPPHNPDARASLMMESGALFVAAHSPQRQKATILADWWMGPEGSLAFSRSLNTFSANTQVDTSHLDDFRQVLIQKLYHQEPMILPRFWEAASGELLQPLTDILSRFMMNPDLLEETLEELRLLQEGPVRE
ncbi:multiple sugar transport system substrate-binding protein [Desulfobotulus alkaliphilus]|uniref:Multiple sugar transport system substrate-binding protein n=1 Tax=Desulfobotulus alkaliphilus TaxID=622671 RepID=A0A562RXK8_9BACT|nr:multiple sugar transport system substrate-binding protein [Desulfobotulus alkaliphilus]